MEVQGSYKWVISHLIWVISIVPLLVTLLTSTHEPPRISSHIKDQCMASKVPQLSPLCRDVGNANLTLLAAVQRNSQMLVADGIEALITRLGLRGR